MMNRTRVYDNGGKTIDRYTLVMPSCEVGMVDMWGFNETPYHPQGFGQYAGSYAPMRSYKHLGKLIAIESLPSQAQQFVKEINS